MKDINFEKVALWLYAILDDIDTVSDHVKGDDSSYRKIVEELQKLKSQVGYSPDGYTLMFKNPTEEYGMTRIFCVRNNTNATNA